MANRVIVYSQPAGAKLGWRNIVTATLFGEAQVLLADVALVQCELS